jgi:exosortase
MSKSVPLLAAGVALLWFAQTRLSTVNSNDRLSVVVFAMVLVWISGFMLCNGMESFRAALFPLLFLILMVPIPTIVLDNIVLALQNGSAVMTYALFKLFGVPVLWRHFKFLLPGVEIEIAQECSGIRSSLALFIASILTGYLFLQSKRKRAFFSLFTIPVVVFKNAVRIVTISCLGVYLDPAFLHGRLHRYGGLPFSLVSLAILVPLLLALQKSEQHRAGPPEKLLSEGAPSRLPAF